MVSPDMVKVLFLSYDVCKRVVMATFFETTVNSTIKDATDANLTTVAQKFSKRQKLIKWCHSLDICSYATPREGCSFGEVPLERGDFLMQYTKV